jgi:hypothetical protein
VLLAPLFPFIWAASRWLGNAQVVEFMTFSAESAVMFAMLCARVSWRTQLVEQREADVILAALRKSPI